MAPWLYSKHPKIPSQKLRWNSQSAWINAGKNMSASLMFLMILVLFSYQYYAHATWWYVAPWVHSHRFVDFGSNSSTCFNGEIRMLHVKLKGAFRNRHQKWSADQRILFVFLAKTFRLGIPMPELWRMDVWFYMSLGCSMGGPHPSEWYLRHPASSCIETQRLKKHKETKPLLKCCSCTVNALIDVGISH